MVEKFKLCLGTWHIIKVYEVNVHQQQVIIVQITVVATGLSGVRTVTRTAGHTDWSFGSKDSY